MIACAPRSGWQPGLPGAAPHSRVSGRRRPISSRKSRRRVTAPKEVVTVGQEVRVKVIKIENDGKRISLSMKDQEPDPWSDVAERYPAGTQFSGRIVRTTDFGLFVEVEPGIDGLVHYSQLPFGVKQGDADIAIGISVTGWIREVDPSKKRLSLSLREVATRDPWDGASQRYPAGKVVEGTVDHGGAPGIFVQIEPGPMPTLMASAPASIRAFAPSAVAMLPATTCTALDRRLMRVTASSTR